MDETSQAIGRREALKLSAKAAGAAAFATPIVVGAFSAPALAQAVVCDPATDSDAVRIPAALRERYNQNCGGTASRYGRYNAQRSEISAPELGPGKTVILQFGRLGTDNFSVECSYYTIVAPTGCVCTVTWAMEQANGTAGCEPGFDQATSVPAAGCDPNQPAPPANALPLPYCKPTSGADGCPSSQKLVVTSLVCCCIN
ncbi:MAG: hypothetical protein H0W25_13505 [Acidimicrobiia bacterium]|nr:hypothetical protein [Acidimicrobiia bacterium]